MRTYSSPRALLVLAVMLAGAAGCAPRNAETSPFQEGAAAGEPTLLLTVDNQDFRDATVYASWNGVKNRVGMVIGKTTETFTTPWRDYQVRLEVDFIGGGENMKVASPISVLPGEHIDFIIMPGW